MKQTEMEIIRALSVKLSEDTVFVLTYQYHTEKDPDDPSGKRNARAKSRYRMLGRVMKTEDAEKTVQTLHTDAYRTKPWKWPEDPSWDGEILYMKDASNEGRSNWLRLKLRKAVGKEEGLALMKGYKKDTDRTSDTFGKYVVFTPNAVYDVKGYSCSDGSKVDVDDLDSLLGKTGQNVWKEIQMKLVGPGAKPFPGGQKKPEATPAEEKKEDGKKEPEVITTT